MPDAPLLLSVPEAARLLGIGRSRAYSMAASGSMPGLVRLGRSVRVSRRRLESWIEEQTRDGAPGAPAT